MITGKQIREARALLRWHRTRLASNAKLPYSTVKRAELTDGDQPGAKRKDEAGVPMLNELPAPCLSVPAAADEAVPG